jgi:hypothetical protein
MDVQQRTIVTCAIVMGGSGNAERAMICSAWRPRAGKSNGDRGAPAYHMDGNGMP